jgi:hypothetical protein
VVAERAKSIRSAGPGYEMHGTAGPGAKEKSYKTGRAVAGDTGVLTAEFDAATAGSGASAGPNPPPSSCGPRGLMPQSSA